MNVTFNYFQLFHDEYVINSSVIISWIRGKSFISIQHIAYKSRSAKQQIYGTTYFSHDQMADGTVSHSYLKKRKSCLATIELEVVLALILLGIRES